MEIDDTSWKSVEIQEHHEVVASDKKPHNASRKGDKFALVIQDWFTKWLDVIPKPSRSGDDIAMPFKEFLGPTLVPDVIYSDKL